MPDVDHPNIGYLCQQLEDLELTERTVHTYSEDRSSHTWKDEGVGVIAVKPDDNGVPCLIVYKIELDPPVALSEVKLYSEVKKNVEYACRARETQITWKCGTEFVYKAIAFTSSPAFELTWTIISEISHSLRPQSPDDSDEVSDGGSELAVPTVGNVWEFSSQLHAIEGRITQVRPEDISLLLRGFTNKKWLDALWELCSEHTKGFESQKAFGASSASTESLEVLMSIADILMRIVVLYSLSFNPFLSASESSFPFLCDDADPLLVLLGDENYMTFFTVLEYERELLKHSKQISHSEFFREKATFKRVLELDDPSFERAVNLIFRLLYLRDVCMPRLLEETALQRFGGIISSGYHYLCQTFAQDATKLEFLKEKMNDDIDAAHFLNKLFEIIRLNLTPGPIKAQIIAAMKKCNILEPLEHYLEPKDNVQEFHRRSSLAVEIIHHAVEIQPALVRQAIFESATKHSDGAPAFWLALNDTLCHSSDEGSLVQLAEIYKHLLSNATLDEHQRDDFLAFFYDRGIIDRLVECLVSEKYPLCGKYQIAECLSFCVRQHQYRMKYKVLKTHLPAEMMKLTRKMNDKILELHVIKFMKACVTSQAEFYTRHFIIEGVIEEILLMLLRFVRISAVYQKSTVVESSIIEFFCLILSKEQESLIAHLFEKRSKEMEFLQEFYGSCKSNIFAKLFEKWKLIRFQRSSRSRVAEANRTTVVNPTRRTPLDQREAEEIYLMDDDEVKSGSDEVKEDLEEKPKILENPPPPPSARLVDYEEDDAISFLSAVKCQPVIQRKPEIKIHLTHLTEEE